MTATAKLFKNGRSQAVRLPRELRFEGDTVRVRRVGRGVLIEPVLIDVAGWFAELDRWTDEPFMPEGREAVQRGLADVKAGRTTPASRVFNRLRRKHRIPR